MKSSIERPWMWLGIHPTCIRCETYTFHYFSIPNKDQSLRWSPNPRIPGSQRKPQKKARFPGISKTPLFAEDMESFVVALRGPLGFFFEEAGRFWDVLRARFLWEKSWKVQPAQQPWETPAIEKNNQWLWHIGTRRTARSTFEPSWSLRMANPGTGSRDGRCPISNFQRWRATRFPKSHGRCSSTFRATKTKSLKYIKTILHLEYLLQYYCVLEARDGYIKLFKGLLVLCREWGTGMIVHTCSYGWGHSSISCV